ncbi:MAG: carboxypeptidase-like regulatory domain-containing protein, partial [Desulfobacterales bacterium]|nr:carboxypeptidase-like regulatory domain-containing protein [Desulfobacterales bacterium]
SNDQYIARLSRVMPTLDTVSAREKAGGSSTIRVVDSDGIPIPYALVSLNGGRPYTTDASGRVALGTRVDGALSVGVRRLGYTPYFGETMPDEKAAEFLVTLNRIASRVDTVKVIADRSTPLSRTGFYDRMNQVRKGAILGSFITPEEIELRASAFDWTQLLRTSQYVRVTNSGLRGRGDCLMQILLDGLPFAGGTGLGTSEIMAIEVYPSTANAPVELIPLTNRGSCGIIAVWTGPRR